MTEKAKLIFAITITSIAAVFGVTWKTLDEKLPANYYPQTLKVFAVAESNFLAETATGIMYTIYESPEDMNVGDLISAVMHKNKTENIIDDYVVDWKYAGSF